MHFLSMYRAEFPTCRAELSVLVSCSAKPSASRKLTCSFQVSSSVLDAL